MAPITCKVCQETCSKYKCPTCLIPYCSLKCFKKHKEIPCSKQPEPSLEEKEKEKEKAKSTPIDELLDGKPYYVDDPGEVLQQSQLESVAASREIREALADKQLQKMLEIITSSRDAESELTKAMQDDSFRTFTDKILEVTNSSASTS